MKKFPPSASTDKSFFYSPIGWLEILTRGDRLIQINFLSEKQTLDDSADLQTVGYGAEVIDQLQAYFSGQRKVFDLNLEFEVGTEFQQRVWLALTKIEYGQTQTYTDLAMAVNNPKAVRAVGGANGKNPIPIVVPCHRVVAMNGLGGYAGGIDVKQQLLELEGARKTHQNI